MSDEAPISPEDFARRFAETAVPLFTEAIRRTMDEWTESQRTDPDPTIRATPEPEWKGGGPPTPGQLQAMTNKVDGGVLDRIMVAVDEIKNAAWQIANADGGSQS